MQLLNRTLLGLSRFVHLYRFDQDRERAFIETDVSELFPVRENVTKE